MSEQGKVEVVKSESRPGKFRIVVHANDAISVGAIQSRAQLQSLHYQIKDLLAETAPPAGDDEFFVIAEDGEDDGG